MTISNDSRTRVKKAFEPIALGMGRLGFTPEPATAPYERWGRGERLRRPVLRMLPAGHVPGRHVC